MKVKNVFLQGELEEHGGASLFPVPIKHISRLPTEEVPIRTEASPACLEREDHVETASDDVCYVEIRLFTIHPTKVGMGR